MKSQHYGDYFPPIFLLSQNFSKPEVGQTWLQLSKEMLGPLPSPIYLSEGVCVCVCKLSLIQTSSLNS